MTCVVVTTWHVQGKSSKAFLDELGFVGREEIIHRNNICLLSIIQNPDADMTQDGVPSLSADDEQTPIKVQPMAYGGMTQQTGIPGLSHPGWLQQPQQQLPGSDLGYYQDEYSATTTAMQQQNQALDNGSEYQQHWQQQQQPAEYVKSQYQSHGQGQSGAAAPHAGQMGATALHAGTYPPSFPAESQQGWHGASGGNIPGVKQESAAQPAFGFPLQQNHSAATAASSLHPSMGHPPSSAAYGGNLPSQSAHPAGFNPAQPNYPAQVPSSMHMY